jgi:N-methylhydantoinase B/oxoprolinase/acetone carboxylase alpha subunit
MKSPFKHLDPVRLEVFGHLFTALAEAMRAALRGAAYSIHSSAAPTCRT